jgi:hypothetical protein
MPAAESVPLGAFAEGVARGASAKGNLTLAQTLVRTVSGRPAIEKWLVPTGSGPSLHVLAFGRNGWVITLVGVPPPGLPRADAEKFRRAVMELRIGPLRETEPDRPAEGGSSASPGLDPGSRRPMSMEKLMERAR